MRRFQIEENIRKILPILSFVDKEKAKAYLRDYGIDLERDNRYCYICNARITYENLGFFIVDGDRVLFVCNKKECKEKFNIFHGLKAK